VVRGLRYAINAGRQAEEDARVYLPMTFADHCWAYGCECIDVSVSRCRRGREVEAAIKSKLGRQPDSAVAHWCRRLHRAWMQDIHSDGCSKPACLVPRIGLHGRVASIVSGIVSVMVVC